MVADLMCGKRLNQRNAQHFLDSPPIDGACDCVTCREAIRDQRLKDLAAEYGIAL